MGPAMPLSMAGPMAEDLFQYLILRLQLKLRRDVYGVSWTLIMASMGYSGIVGAKYLYANALTTRRWPGDGPGKPPNTLPG